MATKTISLKIEAYEKLRAARRYAGESFSQVVLRASWPEATLTGGELVALYRAGGGLLDEDGLRRVERLGSEDRPPEDKWRR